MPSYSAAAALTALLSATSVAAHGHVTNIVINGASYEGFDINVFPYETDFPAVVGWTTPNTGNGFISPDAYNSSDIICHENATNAQGYATVAAGDSISIQWTAWPDSHHGPVIDYLASCGDDCTTVDKTTLEFFKIDGGGLIDDTTVPGDWATDALIDANSTWLVTIPSSIAPGNYVLRHELIALHGAEETDGAQNYPQCFNLKITGSGTDVPTGTLGTELYTADEAGIYVNIYSTLTTYEVPGPTLYSGGTSMVSQVSSAITASVNATTGAAGAAATGAASSAVASVSAAASSAASSAVAASSAAVSSAAASTPVAASSTAAATSVAAASSAPAATSVPASTFVTSVAAAASSSSSGSTACKRKRAAQQL